MYTQFHIIGMFYVLSNELFVFRYVWLGYLLSRLLKSPFLSLLRVLTVWVSRKLRQICSLTVVHPSVPSCPLSPRESHKVLRVAFFGVCESWLEQRKEESPKAWKYLCLRQQHLYKLASDVKLSRFPLICSYLHYNEMRELPAGFFSNMEYLITA